jgi:hypothetical protein
MTDFCNAFADFLSVDPLLSVVEVTELLRLPVAVEQLERGRLGSEGDLEVMPKKEGNMSLAGDDLGDLDDADDALAAEVFVGLGVVMVELFRPFLVWELGDGDVLFSVSVAF